MFCKNCGSNIGESNFCEHCGATANKQQPANNQQYYAPPQNNQQYYAPPQSNGFAVAGFILSLFGGLLGLIFSCIGLSKANQLGGKGRGLAIAGLVISIVWIVVAIALAASGVLGDFYGHN